jgi:Cu/Ag efflux pump CusA
VVGDGLDVLTGADAPLVTRVYGQDLGVLRGEAEKIRRLMSGVEGVVDPRVERPRQQPNLVIEVDLAKAQRHGIKPGDVRRAEATLLQGIHVGSVFDQQKVFDVLVTGVPRVRQSVEDVRNLLLDRPGGGHVRLGQVADVRIEPTPVAIEREAISRYLDVEASVSGRSLADVAGDVRARLAATSFPLEYHAEVRELTTRDEIGLMTVLAFALVAAAAAFLLLQAAFRSWRMAGVGFLLLPAAMVGGVLAALVAGAELSLGSMVGLLAVLAIAARTTILSIRHLQQMDRGHNGGFGVALVREGAQERLVPILTTGAAVALLALPLVALGTRPGLEVVHPMAVVLLGGIVSATLVSLFALPGLYLRHGASTSPPEELVGVRVTQFSGTEHDAEPGRLAVPTSGNGEKTVATPGNGPKTVYNGTAPDVLTQETER